jgi:hypothetical protein
LTALADEDVDMSEAISTRMKPFQPDAPTWGHFYYRHEKKKKNFPQPNTKPIITGVP